MTKKLLLMLVGVLSIGLLINALSPSPIVAQGQGAGFTIHPFEGVALNQIYPESSVLYGRGGDTYNGGGFLYYIYGYDEGNSHVYIETRTNNCGSTVHVPKTAFTEIRSFYSDAQNTEEDPPNSWNVLWQDVNEREGNRLLGLGGDGADDKERINCRVYHENPRDNQEAEAALRFINDGVDIHDLLSIVQEGQYMVALDYLGDGATIGDSRLVTWSGDNFGEGQLVYWFYERETPEGYPLYRETDRGPNQCGSYLYLLDFDISNFKRKQVIEGAWHDVEHDDCLNGDNGRGDNERQVFVTNLNFGNTPDLKQRPNTDHIKYTLQVNQDDTYVFRDKDNPDEEYHYYGFRKLLEWTSGSFSIITGSPGEDLDGDGIYTREVGDSLHWFRGDTCPRSSPHSILVFGIKDSDLKSAGKLIIPSEKYLYNYDDGAERLSTSLMQESPPCNDSAEILRPYSGVERGVLIERISSDEDGGGSPLLPSSPAERTPACEGEAENLGFGWILCPALSLASKAMLKMEAELEGLLRVGATAFEGTAGDDYKNMWRSLRDLATFAIVATALFMVISTAVNAGFLSNYTVKKYLPRLIAGVILIQLSYGLFIGFLEVINEVGDGVNQILVTASNKGPGWNLSQIAGNTVSGNDPSLAGGLSFATAGIVAGFLIGGLGALGALSVLYSGAIALLFGFLFLILREFILISLVIFSPIGLVLWILPGNDKAWRFYMKTFLTLALMYPIIVAVIALGKIFSEITISSGNHNDVVRFVISLLAYVGGYAAIPFMAKRFSGALGQLTGTLNDKSKGIFDKGKNKIEGYKKVRKETKDGAKTRKTLTHGAINDKGSGALDRLKYHRGQYARSKRRLQTGRRVTGREGLVDGTKNVIAGAREGYTAARGQGLSKTEAARQATNERRGRKRKGLSDLTNLTSPKRDMRRASIEKRDIMSTLPAERQKLVEEQVAQDDSRLRNETYKDTAGDVHSLYEARGGAGDPGELARRAVAETSRTRIEAMGQRMLAVGDEDGFGHFAAHAIDPGSSQEHKEAIASLLASGKVAEAFGDKAPDIGKMSSTGFNSALLESPGIEKLEQLSAGAIGRAHAHLGGAFGDQYGSLVSPQTELGEKNWGKLSPLAQQAIEGALGARPPKVFNTTTGTFVPPPTKWP